MDATGVLVVASRRQRCVTTRVPSYCNAIASVSALERLKFSLRNQGLSATLGKLWGLVVDYWFEFRYGLDTCSCSELDGLTVAGDNKAKGYRYQPTRVRPLRRLFNAVMPMVPPESVLVDFGSGKGRVLLVAAESGFREVRGVEFAHELCEVARKNVARYKAKTGVETDFKIIESDAAKYIVSADENVFVVCNPFDETILGAVLDNIAASLRKQPRKVLILYYNPRWGHVIEQRNEFVRVERFNYWGLIFTVYSNRN